MYRFGPFAAILITILAWISAPAEEPTKTGSSLYPPAIVDLVRKNVAEQPWIAEGRDQLIEAARPWAEMSDDALWALMFGPGITRSWMVWSNGHCPACKESVPMYTWKMDALGEPWKVRCPHCNEAFPKNDFKAFYDSGLAPSGVFDPARADRALLFNADHPDPADPLHGFGVDDGEGYVEGDLRWRFIGAYLVYGQWKQAVVNGIRVLAAAHLLTGDPAYAHKAGVLLDRVADVYPGFDYGAQAEVYEKKGPAGYVSVWHDACEETRELVMAYDMVFEALRNDVELVAFLSRKAQEHGLANPKASFAGIQRNIEDRILRDALNNRPKITTNYPRTEIAVAIILTVLGWPENRAQFDEVVNAMLERATAVDGVTGEKGLAGYTCYTIQALAMFLAEYSKADPEFLPDLIRRYPRLRETYRFHIDTLCLDRYYPLSGDTGAFATAVDSYVGMPLSKPAFSASRSASWTLIAPSCYTLLLRFAEITGDPAYAQIAYRGNGLIFDGLPWDIYLENPKAVADGLRAIIEREGPELRLGSVNKEQWHIAVLRSVSGPDARAIWLDYDSVGGHSHCDAMNLGLFAKGLDLMPDFGYPPVQFGGWSSPRALWYKKTAAHNTVVVDGVDASGGAGVTTLWADGRQFRAIRAAGPEMNQGRRYERTVAAVDISPEDGYVIDMFRVSGGATHTKFMHSHFGTVELHGAAPQPAPDFGNGTEMRNFRLDPAPAPGWSADWAVEDRRAYLPAGTAVHLRYTDFTSGAAAGLIEAWIVSGLYNSTEEVWIPRVVTQRTVPSGGTLDSTFVGVIEPYTTAPLLSSIARLPVLDGAGQPLGDSHTALLLTLPDGRRDFLLLRDPEDPAGRTARITDGIALETDADTCLVRLDAQGALEYAAASGVTTLNINGAVYTWPQTENLAELP